MNLVTEQQIEKAALAINDLEGDLKHLLDQLNEQQPILLSYILSDNFKLLTEAERQYLLYLTLVIWTAVRKASDRLKPINEDIIGQLEESNWTIMQNSNAKLFRDKLDVFFDDYPQEDLLAFVEDALADDENEGNDPVTKIGREPIFIALKTIIDVLTS